jgi:hypothetical protein
MPDISDISKSIERKKQLDTNLLRYVKAMAGLYHRLSSMKLAMNYYMFAEQQIDEKDSDTRQVRELFGSLNEVILENVLADGNEALEQDMEKLSDIRSQIIATMEIVTAYVDRLAIYEHILNRVEFEFSDEEFDENYYENSFTNDIMHYIIEVNDAAVSNGRIGEMVTQLPMRLTRQKFFERLKDAFSLYKGNDLSSLNDFAYMVRTLSGIYEPEGFGVRFEYIHELYRELEQADYKDIDKAQYEKLSDILSIAAQAVTGLSDLYVNLMELVNDAYIILLTKEYAIMDSDEQAACHNILQSAMSLETQQEDVNDSFICLEGHQERVYNQISSNDYVIDTVLENLKDEAVQSGVYEAFQKLRQCAKLSSGSYFVVLADNPDIRTATQEDVERVYESILTPLQNSFAEHPTIFNRAVMAIVLGSLPVFFENVDEIQSYINTSLSQCRSRSERMACVKLIRMIIDEA